MLLPQTAEYALRAVLRLAERHPMPLSVAHLARLAEAPRNYLSKTLSTLARDGVLVASRGPAGGYRLATPPDELIVGDVVGRFIGGSPRQCLLRRAPCSAETSCLVHDRWAPAARAIEDFLTRTTVADLLEAPATASVATHSFPRIP